MGRILLVAAAAVWIVVPNAGAAAQTTATGSTNPVAFGMTALTPGSGKLETAIFSADRLENQDTSAGAIRWKTTFEGAVQVDPQVTPERPFGRIVMPGASWVALDLEELPGAHPYLSCSGIGPEVQDVRVNFTYAFRDGSLHQVDRRFDYDPELKRRMALGPAMSGTLGPWGRPARVQLTVGGNQAYEIHDCQIGWLRPHMTLQEQQALQARALTGLRQSSGNPQASLGAMLPPIVVSARALGGTFPLRWGSTVMTATNISVPLTDLASPALVLDKKTGRLIVSLTGANGWRFHVECEVQSSGNFPVRWDAMMSPAGPVDGIATMDPATRRWYFTTPEANAASNGPVHFTVDAMAPGTGDTGHLTVHACLALPFKS